MCHGGTPWRCSGRRPPAASRTALFLCSRLPPTTLSQPKLCQAPTQPYTPGQNKQQYLRGRQQQQQTQDQDQYLPLISGQVAVQGVQTLPSPIVLAPREQAPFVSGTNKQQHLRGAPEEAGVQYVPLIQVRGQSPNIGVQTLPVPSSCDYPVSA